MQEYTLYVGNNCNSCKNVQQIIFNQKIGIKTVNIDEENYDLPFAIMIIPALVKDNKILAYGADINPILAKKIL